MNWFNLNSNLKLIDDGERNLKLRQFDCNWLYFFIMLFIKFLRIFFNKLIPLKLWILISINLLTVISIDLVIQTATTNHQKPNVYLSFNYTVEITILTFIQSNTQYKLLHHYLQLLQNVEQFGIVNLPQV